LKKTPQIYIDQPIGRFLSGTGRDFLSLLNKKLSHLDIERNYYALILIEAGEGKITQQDLSIQLGTDKVSVVRIIDYLSGKGYVKRIKDTVDRRKYSLVLTNKAKKEMPNIKKALNDITNITFNGLKASQIKELYNILSVIKTNLIKNS